MLNNKTRLHTRPRFSYNIVEKKNNEGVADIILTSNEISAIDNKLDNINMSAVFGGSKVIKRGSNYGILFHRNGQQPLCCKVY